MMVSSCTAPPHSSATLRVITLITPPMASEPYRVDMGPRTTSIRSMDCSGGSQSCSKPALPLGRVSRVDTGLPSTRIRVYWEGMPRITMSLPRSPEPPPVMITPGMSRSASVAS